jgi:hypothetical protein
VNQSLRPPSILSTVTSAGDYSAPAPCPKCGAARDRTILSGVEGYFVAAVCSRCGSGSRESRFYSCTERAQAALDNSTFVRLEF